MKKNNKGFSLVELIIVIAIMAVLVSILAPQYIKYVEKSRIAKDAVTLDEILRAAQVALIDPDNTSASEGTITVVVGSGDKAGKVIIKDGNNTDADKTNIVGSITQVLGSDIYLVSNDGKNLGNLHLTVSMITGVAWSTTDTETGKSMSSADRIASLS